MMFNLKHIFLFGLVAISAASPTFDVEAAKIPDPLRCDGRTWTKRQIVSSKAQARSLQDAEKAYPKVFKNRGIFNTGGELWEFPLTDPVWNGNTAPGTFRVIMKDDYTYIGVTNKDRGTGGTVHRC